MWPWVFLQISSFRELNVDMSRSSKLGVVFSGVVFDGLTGKNFYKNHKWFPKIKDNKVELEKEVALDLEIEVHSPQFGLLKSVNILWELNDRNEICYYLGGNKWIKELSNVLRSRDE